MGIIATILLNPWTRNILIVGVIIASALVWINQKANEKYQAWIDDFKTQQEELLKEFKEESKKNTEVVLQELEKDRETTNDLIKEFSKTDGANDSSGINGKFLRN